MPTYRPVTAGDRARFEEITGHAFAIEQGPDYGSGGADGVDADGPDGSSVSPTADGEWPPALSEPRGVFDGDRLLSVCKLYHLDAFLHGGYETVGGLGAVATPPEHRREGHVRTLAAGALEEYREAGVTVVALWPFSTPFYRHLGWGVANKYTRYELPPDQLAPARGGDGEVQQLSPDDWERLRPVEAAFGEGTHLSLRRSERWWRERTLGGWPDDDPPYVYGYERDGELCGFVSYTVGAGDGGRQLNVGLLAHADEGAYRGLLGFLSEHDSQVERIRLHRAAETALLDRVPDPGRVDCTVESGPMVRLTDVAGALERYPWPDRDVEFTLSVSDPLLSHNDGRFSVTVDGGTATVERTAATDSADEEDAVDTAADASVDVATLSQLYVGSYDAPTAQEVGELAVTRESLGGTLAAAFDGNPVCLREFF